MSLEDGGDDYDDRDSDDSEYCKSRKKKLKREKWPWVIKKKEKARREREERESAWRDRERCTRGRRVGSTNKGNVERAERVFLLMGEGMSRGDALETMGYSRNNHCLETKPNGKIALANIERQRKELQEREGYRLEDIACRFKGRATDPDVSANAQNDADKALVGMLDYTPVKKVEVACTGLLMEFKDVPLSELMKLHEDITGEEAEFEEVDGD